MQMKDSGASSFRQVPEGPRGEAWSDSCRLEDLAFLHRGFTEYAHQLDLDERWARRWTTRWKFGRDAAATYSVRDLNEVDVPRTVPVRRFTVDEVPPYLPLDWFSDHFTDLRTQLPDVTYRDDRLLRRGASLRLAELVTGLTWPECAEALKVGNGMGRYTLNALGRRLTDNRLGPAFTRAVDQVAERLDGSAHRTDYARRRRRMARWSMGDTHWSHLFEKLPRLTHMRSTADPRIASIIVWSDVTRAEAPQCPIVKKERGRGDA